jgi:hypothetical protein
MNIINPNEADSSQLNQFESIEAISHQFKPIQTN